MKYHVRYDKKLGFRHLFPIPSKKELVEYYEKEFYSADYGRVNDSSREIQKRDEDFYRLQYADILETIRQEAPGRKILDIGCGYGNFIKFCNERGFKASGFDPSGDAVRHAQDQKLDVFQGEIEDLYSLVKEKYDAVVLLNVLEHVREPLKVLNDIKQFVLKKNGILVVRAPNEFNPWQLAAQKKYKLDSWWISPPQHINYFSISDLEKILQGCGFKILVKESTFPLELFILMGEQYVGHPEIGRKIHQKRILFEKNLSEYDNNLKRSFFRNLAEAGLGREVTFFVKK